MPDNPVLEPGAFYSTEESEQKPTEEAVVVTEESETLKAEAEPEQDLEKETEQEAEASQAADEGEELLVIDLDGKEVDLNSIREWRDHGLMQADYTRKTKSLATERKEFEQWQSTERDSIAQTQAKVNEQTDLLKVLVNEDQAIDWVRLKDEDLEQYVELKEKADQRKDALDKIRAERMTPADDPALIAAEQRKLFDANPNWLEDGKTTEAFKDDTTLMNDYAINAGFTSDEFSKMTKAHYLSTILKAAKYDQLQEKGRKVKSDRDKVPVIPKPKGKKVTEPQTDMATQFYGTN